MKIPVVLSTDLYYHIGDSDAGHNLPTQERNAADDPVALRLLLNSELPITILPCDITCWPFDFYRLVGSRNPLCDFLAKEVFWAYLVREPMGTPVEQADRYTIMEQQIFFRYWARQDARSAYIGFRCCRDAQRDLS